MAKFNDKISTILNSQLPEFVVADHPKFAEFLKVYYQLLESAELSIDTIEGTDGILLQSETGQTNNLVLNSSRKDTARTLLDAGDKFIYYPFGGCWIEVENRRTNHDKSKLVSMITSGKKNVADHQIASREALLECFRSEAHKEGVASFIDKQKPNAGKE